jgi:hypothetical protein
MFYWHGISVGVSGQHSCSACLACEKWVKVRSVFPSIDQLVYDGFSNSLGPFFSHDFISFMVLCVGPHSFYY